LRVAIFLDFGVDGLHVYALGGMQAAILLDFLVGEFSKIFGTHSNFLRRKLDSD